MGLGAGGIKFQRAIRRRASQGRVFTLARRRGICRHQTICRSESGKRIRIGRIFLNRRLIKYPCSYLIYSPAFDALPPAAKDPIYRRMWDVLSGQEQDPRYRSVLSRTDRQAIVEILRDTKKDLPPYFQNAIR